jgi:hypothetical protein
MLTMMFIAATGCVNRICFKPGNKMQKKHEQHLLNYIWEFNGSLMIMQGGYMDLMMEHIYNSQGESVSEVGNEMQSGLCTQNETMNNNLLVAPCETYTQMIL